MSINIVFISYSHDSETHSERVLGLSERLRADGIETRLDQYVNGTPKNGWPRWMLDQLDEADSVLVVCTETYYRRFRGHEEPGKGKGADWEGAMITQEIYDARSNTVKFVPVLFVPDDEPFIPEPLRSATYYLLNSADNYAALYDSLLGQAGVEPRPLGELKVRERKRGTALGFHQTPRRSTGQTQVAPSRLHHGADRLFGREQELAALGEIANDQTKKILTIVAFGGVGKTSLVIEWMGRQASNNWQGFERVFDWSFFSQGTREQGGASADTFIVAALRFFGDEAMAETAASPWDKGARLAQLISQRRTLVVLDGIEPLQHPPGPLAGELKDPALAALLKGLARQNSGLCIVTSRERVTDLAAFRGTTAPEWELHHLSITAGVELLKELGLHGASAELDEVVKEVKGHALTLNLLGRYLARAHQGDIRKRDQVKFERADSKILGGYAFKTIGAYERWLTEGGEEGARSLAVLRLLGLFDRPADADCLNALRNEPSIEGLTELLIGLNDADWNIAVASLEDCGLVSVQSNDSAGAKWQSAIDAHPLIREYFASRLRENNSQAWRAAHRRLYEHLCATTKEGDQPTLEDLQPLYQAVAHGCQAGLQQEACDKIYIARILRGEEAYSTFKLGALGADLGAIACFFEIPWSRVSPTLKEYDQAWMLNETAVTLRALGRLTEALEPFRIGLSMRIKQRGWSTAARLASSLSELDLTLGEVTGAVKDAEQSVTYADRSSDDFGRFMRLLCRADYAYSLYQAGRRAEAETRFREAEQMQAVRQPGYALLYSLQGFLYCDFLLAISERSAWQTILQLETRTSEHETVTASCRTVSERGAQTLKWVTGKLGLLDEALDHLTLARTALYEATQERSAVVSERPATAQPKTGGASLPVNRLVSGLALPAVGKAFPTPALQTCRRELDAAVSGLRRAGSQDHIPLGLLTRAWLRFLTGARTGPDSAQEDLDEAWEIAERGPMKLFLADIHLYRARLFGRPRAEGGDLKSEVSEEKYPWESPAADLAAAEKLINDCGYHRRDEELADAKAALKEWEQR